MNTTADQIKQQNPLQTFLESRGVKIVGRTTNRCAEREHKPGHLCVSLDFEKGLWNCHDCDAGGDVITWMAKESGKSPAEVLKSFGGGVDAFRPFQTAPATQPEARRDPNAPRPTIKKTYQYHDELGGEVYQAVRLEPKSFRQRHRGPGGEWVWTMDGVERVLFRMPEILKATTVALAEGEKDAETLVALGYCGSCNVGGAGKWMDGYTEALAGKEVLIFGDNDKAGQDHVRLVFDSIAGKAAQVKIIKIPAPYKDVTEYVESFTELKEAQAVIAELVSDAHPFIKGKAMKLLTMAEIEPRYIRFASNPDTESFHLSKWLPSFGLYTRALVPGEVVLIIGNTGTGKTAILQSIALAAAPLPTVLFEIELPAELVYERFCAAKHGIHSDDIEQEYRKGITIGKAALDMHFKNLFICDDAKLTTEALEAAIIDAELKIGTRPKVVLLDYIQLLRGTGKDRYDRASTAAEDVKRIAKSTRTIIIVASQRGRPKATDEPEVFLHDAKESGSLENSAGLVLGAWRDVEDRGILHLKIVKNTKGTAGHRIACNFDGATMRITERSKFEPEL